MSKLSKRADSEKIGKSYLRGWSEIITLTAFVAQKCGFEEIRVFACTPLFPLKTDQIYNVAARMRCTKDFMQLDYEALNERLSPKLAKLVNYIFRCQGNELRRLDYTAAAKELGFPEPRRSGRTAIKRLCDQLADKQIIIFNGNMLRLSDDVLKAG